MRFTAPLLLAATVSAVPAVKYQNLQLTSNNEADCTDCTSVDGDTMALQFCLAFVPPECTYTVEAIITGDASTCPSAFGIDLGNITIGIEGLEVTSMKGSLDLVTDGTTGTCNLKGTVVDDSTQQCSGAPPKEDITAELKDGKGTLSLDNIIGNYISLKADSADVCGTKISTAKFSGTGATATLTAKGLKVFPGGDATDPSEDGSGSDGVAPLFGASLFISLLGALHIA